MAMWKTPAPPTISALLAYKFAAVARLAVLAFFASFAVRSVWPVHTCFPTRMSGADGRS